MSRSARIVPALLIAVTLIATAASADSNARAKPWQREIAASPVIDLFSRLWNTLASFWTKNGCGGDPNGLCKQGAGSAETKNGCQVDPDGHCEAETSSATTKNGCEVDPDGHCVR